MKRTVPSLLALALLLPAAAAAKSVREPGIDGICGTSASTLAISRARHQFNQRRIALERPDLLTVGGPGKRQTAAVTKQKNVAVMVDDGTIFPPPNFFDLINLGVQFKHGAKGMRGERFASTISSNRGNRISIGDDASRTINLPFTFPFYGNEYNRVFLNSDGNLTFNQADSASTARSLNRFLEGTAD